MAKAKEVVERRENPPGLPVEGMVWISTGQLVRALTDDEFAAVKERINTAIHELVWAAAHLEDNEFGSALDSLNGAGEAILQAQGVCLKRLEA
jgi:hypothetical protein